MSESIFEEIKERLNKVMRNFIVSIEEIPQDDKQLLDFIKYLESKVS